MFDQADFHDLPKFGLTNTQKYTVSRPVHGRRHLLSEDVSDGSGSSVAGLTTAGG